MSPDPQMTRYLIAGPTRSGTTALHLMLAGHPQVAALTGELAFARLAAGLGGFTVRGYVTDDEERLGRAALFDAVAGACRTPRTRALGAKTTVNSARAARALSTVLAAHLESVKVIVMVRRDLVAHYYSRSALKRTGVAHSWSGGGENDGPARVDRWLLASSALATTSMYAQLREIGTFADCLEVEYEAFAHDNLAIYRRVLEFLDLDHVEPEWHHSIKLHEDPERSIPDYRRLTRYVHDLLERDAGGRLPPSYRLWLRAYARGRGLLRGLTRGRRR